MLCKEYQTSGQLILVCHLDLQFRSTSFEIQFLDLTLVEMWVLLQNHPPLTRGTVWSSLDQRRPTAVSWGAWGSQDWAGKQFLLLLASPWSKEGRASELSATSNFRPYRPSVKITLEWFHLQGQATHPKHLTSETWGGCKNQRSNEQLFTELELQLAGKPFFPPSNIFTFKMGLFPKIYN